MKPTRYTFLCMYIFYVYIYIYTRPIINILYRPIGYRVYIFDESEFFFFVAVVAFSVAFARSEIAQDFCRRNSHPTSSYHRSAACSGLKSGHGARGGASTLQPT